MFVPVSVCWIVNRIIQKLQNRSAWNLDGWRFSTHKRPHLVLVQIWIKGTDPGGEFWDFHDIFVSFSGNDLGDLNIFYMEGRFFFTCSTLINRDITSYQRAAEIFRTR